MQCWTSVAVSFLSCGSSYSALDRHCLWNPESLPTSVVCTHWFFYLQDPGQLSAFRLGCCQLTLEDMVLCMSADTDIIITLKSSACSIDVFFYLPSFLSVPYPGYTAEPYNCECLNISIFLDHPRFFCLRWLYIWVLEVTSLQLCGNMPKLIRFTERQDRSFWPPH